MLTISFHTKAKRRDVHEGGNDDGMYNQYQIGKIGITEFGNERRLWANETS